MKSIASSDPQQIDSPPQLANIVPIRRRAVRDEDRVPYDAGYQAERNGQYEAGFVIVPPQWRDIPASVRVRYGGQVRRVTKCHMLGVYTLLASHAIASATVWPSIKTVATELGISEDQAGRTIVALENVGMIVKRNRDNHGMKQSNEYRLVHQKTPKDQMPPVAGTLPPTAVLDTASGGAGYRPRRQEVDNGERDNSEEEQQRARAIYAAFVQTVTGKQAKSIGARDLETATALADMGVTPGELPPFVDWLKTQGPFQHGFSFAALKSQYLAWRTTQPTARPADTGPLSQDELANQPYTAWRLGVYQNIHEWRADKRAGTLAQLDGSRP